MAAVLTTHHNLFFIQDLMDSIRTAVDAGSFLSLKKEFLQSYRGEESS
jgi:tRNA-guanine family transglycosylase